MALWARIDDKKQRGGLVVSLWCQRWSVWNRRWSVVGGRGARARPGNGDAAAWRSGWRENRRERFGEEEEEDDMWDPRVSDKGDEVYVFIYVCSWAQAVSICILWHFCVKRRIVMACFQRGE